MRVFIKPLTLTTLCLLLISLSGVSYSLVLEIERDSLIALYNSTDGANWKDNTGWLGAAGTECGWHGVTCSSGSISSINLVSNSLNGSIPSELGNLKKLHTLWLAGNSLSQSIPSELGNLTKLTNLTLNNNKFSRPKPAWLNSFTINDNAFDADADKDGIDDAIDTNLNSVAMIKRIIDPDYSLSILGSGRVVNLVSGPLFNETSGALSYSMTVQITKILYSHLKDEFDFIMIAANNKECCSDAEFYGRFRGAQKNTKGLGESMFDSTGFYGSAGKLQAVIHFPYLYGLPEGPSLHEIAHNWGNDLIKTEVKGHWGYSNVGGQLGGWQPGSLAKRDDGTYQARGPLDTEPSDWGSFANGLNSVPYSNLELYVMGMIGAEEVGHDIKIAEDFEWTDDYSKGIFNASSITTLTMDQIIAERGPREPNHLDSQKNFRAIYVVVSELPLTREEWRVADKLVYDFQLEGDDGYSTYNFWEATRGKGTMAFDQLHSSLTTTATTFDPSNDAPIVSIFGGNRIIADTDNAAGESVSVTGTGTDSDGTIATTQWLVHGHTVAIGLSATLELPNGSTVVTFKATDNDGESSTTTATITVKTPSYEPTQEWPSPYNGVTPDSSFGLEFNNVGVFSSSDATIYVCLRIFTDGLPSSYNRVSQFDMGLKVVSLPEATVQITKSKEFNTIGALNESAQTPDCSGKYETTTGLYTDIIQTDTSVLETTWSLVDANNLILKLDSFKELTAN